MTTINASWLCFVIPLGLFLLVMYFGIRSRLRYYKRLSEARSRGVFEDMGEGPKRKFRSLSIIALVGLIGIACSFGLFLLTSLRTISISFMFIIVLFGISGLMSATAGLLMQREINRKL